MALFFTFYGYYMTMLWLPALWGLALFVSQMASHAQTQSWENPYVLTYALSMSVWAVLVSQLWRRLEGTRRYEWDTLAFEEQETELLAFRSAPRTHTHTLYLPPSGPPPAPTSVPVCLFLCMFFVSLCVGKRAREGGRKGGAGRCTQTRSTHEPGA